MTTSLQGDPINVKRGRSKTRENKRTGQEGQDGTSQGAMKISPAQERGRRRIHGWPKVKGKTAEQNTAKGAAEQNTAKGAAETTTTIATEKHQQKDLWDTRHGKDVQQGPEGVEPLVAVFSQFMASGTPAEHLSSSPKGRW